MKRNWFVAGAKYTLKEVKAAGRICGWIIKDGVVYSDKGHLVGWRL